MKNTQHHFTTTLRDRDLDGAGFQPLPTRFSTDIEGEGMEVFLRGFLVACLIAALMICGFRLPASSGSTLPTVTDGAAVAAAVVAPICAPAVAAPRVSLL